MPILDLSKMTKDELLRLADKIKIPVKKAMLKGEILTVLKRETRKAAKLAEAKKAKAKSQKTPSRSVPKKKRKRFYARKNPVSRSASPSPSKFKGSKGYDVRSLQPKFELEDMAQEAKFIIGKPDIRDESHGEISPELPLDYGDNKIVMLVRDPYWCYLYWELQEGHIEDGLRRLSRSRNEVRHVLRVHPASGGKAPFDVDVDFRHQNHYLQLSPGASFYSEIGLLDLEGNFAALAVSNTVSLPLDGPSEIIDEKWITTDENFEEIYILSGGEVAETEKTREEFRQVGSVELQKARLGQSGVGLNISSSGVDNFGSAKIQKPSQERSFSYWLNMELILYGGADLGSTIKLSGKNLDLRPDGTFTVRFGLPEGELKLPVTFISPDQAEVHTITPNVTRRTETKTGGSDQ
ncbi:MAG: DUF4912 domain-containing protein [Nitrospinae bacterium]|nr:DUF4912 domain-containing protein [Nitrospinota bacterium]